MGITLRAARVNKGLTQAEAAERLGVRRETVFNWETGKTMPDVPAINKIVELYGVPFDELIFCPDVTPKAKIR